MNLLFMGWKSFKAIRAELSRVLKTNVVAIDVCKSWDQRFKSGNFIMDDRSRIRSLLTDEPFFSRQILGVRLLMTHQTIKSVLQHDMGMRRSAELGQ
jgi:hypothetical protein